MRPVLVATPCRAELSVNYVSSIVRLPKCVDFFFCDGESLVTRARNICVAQFLDGDWQNLFFIDSDIGFTEPDFERLLEAPFPVIAAPYAKKGEDGGQTPDPSRIGEPDENGFAVAQEAPTGFMRIKRFVLEKMRASGIQYWEYFDTMFHENNYLSEDYAFCRRWQALQGSIHLDTRTQLTHHGSKLYAL